LFQKILNGLGNFIACCRIDDYLSVLSFLKTELSHPKFARTFTALKITHSLILFSKGTNKQTNKREKKGE
jgi:hypothetical protein